MRGGGERSASNNQGNIQTITNIQAIDNFIDNQINIKTPSSSTAHAQKTQGGGNTYYGKGSKNPTATAAGQKTRAITQIRKTSTV